MVVIKCTHYEKNEFIRFLEELKERKKNDKLNPKEKFDTTKYDIERINVLIKRVNGEFKESYLQNSKEYRESNPSRGNKKDPIDPESLFKESLY